MMSLLKKKDKVVIVTDEPEVQEEVKQLCDFEDAKNPVKVKLSKGVFVADVIKENKKTLLVRLSTDDIIKVNKARQVVEG